MATDQEYVLGTHDEEIARLALQHRVWREQALAAWRRAGFGPGQTIIDLGCGSGNATLDLAEIVGPSGHVVAVDKSRRFLDIVDARARERGFRNVATYEVDFDRDPLPAVRANGVWDRWALSFTTRPRELLAGIADCLAPAGVFVVHEYFDYGTWRSVPPTTEIDRFVTAVIETWRESGGEPNIGLQFPTWLHDQKFEITDVRPIVETTRPGEPKWSWLAAFIESGRKRLASLGVLTAEESRAIGDRLSALAADPNACMITPALFEIIAISRS
jgi:SAM-dependent methyltransferase